MRYLVIAKKAKELVQKQKRTAQQEEERSAKVTVKTVTSPKTAENPGNKFRVPLALKKYSTAATISMDVT